MIISKAASFPLPAQKGKNNCCSQDLKGPISPSPGGIEAFPGSSSPHQREDPGWLLAASSSSSHPAKERSRSPGVHTFLRQRAGLPLCSSPFPFQPPLCHVLPGTARLMLSGSTKGTLHTGASHWQRTCGA